MSESTSTIIFEMAHQQNAFPNVPHPRTKLFVKFGPRGVLVQILRPGQDFCDEEMDLPVEFITLIDVMYLSPTYEELQMELHTLNGEEIWVSPEVLP